MSLSNTSEIGNILETVVKEFTDGKNIAVAFSGGLDSGIIAALTKKYASSVHLYTVGNENAYDVRMSDRMSKDLDMDWKHIVLDETAVLEALRDSIRITGTTSPLRLAFDMPLYFVCKNCEEDTIIGGQGSDELFAGYSKYLGLSDDDLLAMIEKDICSLKGPTLEHEKKVADHFGKTVLYPFLDERIFSAVRSLDISEIKPKDSESRKMMLKEIAISKGYPFIADKQKKAAQYGSGMMDLVHKICRSKNIKYSELVEQICSEEGVECMSHAEDE